MFAVQGAGEFPLALIVVIGAVLCVFLFLVTVFWDRIAAWLSDARERLSIKSGD